MEVVTDYRSLSEVACLGDRYFSMLAIQGELLFPAAGIAPWDARAMFYCDETIVDHMLDPEKGERKVTTAGELEHALELSQQHNTTIRVWVHESLEDLVKQLID